jgi:hypothetical protein
VGVDRDLEALGPDSFQRLCQTLLVRAYPDSQVFPLRQRDAGRDAVSFAWEGGKRSIRVFQVKFVENPSSIKDPHKWIVATMKDEAPKVANLIPQGAVSYHLITNVRGTGYGESGSIDRLDSVLAEAIGIPSTGWWRDDVATRLAESSHLRWEFPELLNGLDVIRDLIESDLGDAQRRRTRALRAFLTQQYDDDKKIRFKQVDLQNDLLGLFIDVPVSVQVSGRTARQRYEDASAWNELHNAIVKTDDASAVAAGWVDPGMLSVAPRRIVFPTSDLLLDADFQRRVPRVVIEGAPGQGKSTLTQYLCQVHRMRILDEDLARLPSAHSAAPLRLPFRLDLRDVAEWLGGSNPFSPGEELPLQWPRTLEGFLAANVHYYSGGVSFDVADLLAVIERSATLVVCDGLDEVADIDLRRSIVEELTAAAGRLDANASSLQLIVTSRPADFAKSPGFDSTDFRYMSLEALPPQAAEEYSEKWVKAKNLDGGDATEVRRVLAEKLNLSHMRELARNAMQLTILLSLIYARGSSLPDKRTALYDAYIDTFLDRESEKSAVVREHRDLLLALHGHLAWMLHHETEGGGASGRISRDRLSDEISRYLGQRGHATSIIGDLFDGVVERVFVLVSRVEGTYEFEVQPLREYFAARHLYNTAPYAPTGADSKGTISERFAALARNPYWLNVARFYAGCFSEGEIASLVYGLRDLIEQKEFKVLGHPRVLAGMLLADWVFSQVPRSVPSAVEMMGDPLGVQLAGGARRRRAAPVFGPLPERSGQSELAELLIGRLDRNPKVEYANSLALLLREQAPGVDLGTLWLSRSDGKEGKARTKWLQHGVKLGVVRGMGDDQLDALLAPSASRDELLVLMRAGRGDYCERGSAVQEVVEAILDGEMVGRQRPAGEPMSTLEEFGLAHLVSFYEMPDGDGRSGASTMDDGEPRGGTEVLDRCERVVRVARRLGGQPLGTWYGSLDPWEELVEVSKGEFGERWIHRVLALQAAGIRSSEERYSEASALFDVDTSLARRARYARLRAGNPQWWGRQLEAASTSDERLFAAAILFTWGSGRTLLAHIEQLDQLLTAVKVGEWGRVLDAVQRADHTWRPFSREAPRRLDVKVLPGLLSERTVVTLASRHAVETQRELYDRYLRDYAGRHPAVLDLCVAAEMTRRSPDARVWRRVLKFLSRHPGRPRVAFTPYALLRYGAPQPSMPLSVAREICEEAERYPQDLVARAEDRCRSAVDFIPVGSVAARRGWFSS